MRSPEKSLFAGQNIFSCRRRPLSLRFNTSRVTLPGFAGGKYSPLPAPKGPAFPLRSAELTSKPVHPRWVSHFSSRLRSGTTAFSKSSGTCRGGNLNLRSELLFAVFQRFLLLNFDIDSRVRAREALFVFVKHVRARGSGVVICHFELSIFNQSNQ